VRIRDPERKNLDSGSGVGKIVAIPILQLCFWNLQIATHFLFHSLAVQWNRVNVDGYGKGRLTCTIKDIFWYHIRPVQRKSFHRISVYFLWIKKSQMQATTQDFGKLFIKQLLDFTALLKFYSRHWALISPVPSVYTARISIVLLRFNKETCFIRQI
jgi:hypothetical protein